MNNWRNFFQAKNQFVLVFLCGVAIFLHHLTQPGFFMDGMIYAAFSKNAVNLNYWLVPHLTDTLLSRFSDHVSFIIILQGLFFKIFGASYGSARFFINIFTITSLVVLFKWVRGVFKDGVDGEFRHLPFYVSFFFILIIPFLRHSRFPNFDAPLMLFNFLAIVFFYKRLVTFNNKYWYGVGICFGLAMLSKGPMAIFVPGTILSYLIFTKQLKMLKSIHPWIGMFLGFALFGLWPLSLYLTGNFDIFLAYFQANIINSIIGSRGHTENDYFLYLRHLLIYCAPHLFFLSYGIFKFFKEKKMTGEKKDFYLLNLIMFLFVFILSSKMIFKYAHYISSLYPSMAILAGIGLNELKSEKLHFYLKGVLVLVALVVVFEPNRKTRDADVYKLLPKIDQLKIAAKTYYLVNGAYPYYSLNPLLNFHDGSDTIEINLEEIKKIENRPGENFIFIKDLEAKTLDLNRWKKIGELPSVNASLFLKR